MRRHQPRGVSEALVAQRTADWDSEKEEEEAAAAVEALVAQRTKEVEHCKKKIQRYMSKLDEAKKALAEANELSSARCRAKSSAQPQPQVAGEASVVHLPPELLPARPVLVVPSRRSMLPPPPPPPPALPPAFAEAPTAVALPSTSSLGKKGKRKFDQQRQIESKNLVVCIASSSSATLWRLHTSTLISSQHKRRLRCLELCPTKDSVFATSALDGVINLWQMMPKGPSISMINSADCLTPKDRRWPEDLAWHPDGGRIFSVYSADGGDAQISVLTLNSLSGQEKVTFLREKPHIKGLLNTINFMPWASDTCFVTGGSDHALFLWQEKGCCWKPKVIHKHLHSSAVMGVCGLLHKETILSVGVDKRVIAYDILAGIPEFQNQLDSKCMSVLPNPIDFNLYMIQTGTPNKQLRLYDTRMRSTEVHAFGWNQSSSESQSALIKQSWSTDGLCLSSGSMDPMIHIFDIRFNGSIPGQSMQAHEKRVFKAIWHRSKPFLTSISSDLYIGMHRVT